jgi:hypothetical protein
MEFSSSSNHCYWRFGLFRGILDIAQIPLMNVPQHSMSEVDLRLNSIRLNTIRESAKSRGQKSIAPTNFVPQLSSSTHSREL